MPVVKVAFVGCGTMMEAHAKRLAKLPEVALAGCCDADAERAEEAARVHGGAAFTDPATMFDTVKPDAAYICVPPGSRGPMEAAAAQRGIHLFLEKPVALSRKEARALATAVRVAGIIVSVGYCYRYLDTVQRARKELSGRPVTLVRGCWAGPMPRAPWGRPGSRRKACSRASSASARLPSTASAELSSLQGLAPSAPASIAAR